MQKKKGGNTASQSKKRKRIVMQFEVDVPHYAGEKAKGKSLTQPDMNLSVRQLIQGYTRGQTAEELNKAMQNAPYFDMEIPVFNDLTDVEKFKEKLQADIEAADKWIKEQQALKEKEVQLPDITVDANGAEITQEAQT